MSSPFTTDQDAAIDQVQAMRLDYDRRYHPSKLPAMDPHAEPKSTGITLRYRQAIHSARSDRRRAITEWRATPQQHTATVTQLKAGWVDRVTAWLWYQHDFNTALWTAIGITFAAGLVAITTGFWKP
jgi:hypothetical protein